MFKVGEIVVHKRDICKIKKIIKKYRSDEDYYMLIPIEDSSLVIHTPVSNKFGLIRGVINKKSIDKLIKQIPEIGTIDFEDGRFLEVKYLASINSGNHEDIVSVMKTAYQRNQEKIASGLKYSNKDKTYLNIAEKILYSEFSVALSVSYDDAKKYVEKRLAKQLASKNTNI